MVTVISGIGASAYIADARRSRHSRGTPPHYGSDVDTVIALGKAIGVYSVGDDLHTVLTAIVNRIIDLEGKSRTLAPEFTAGSIFMRPRLIEAIQLAAALIVRTVENLTASSVLLRESTTGAVSVDAWVYGIFATETALIDAILQIARSGSLSADAILLMERQVDVLIDAFIGGLAREASLSADAVVQRLYSSNLTADAIRLKTYADTALTVAISDGADALWVFDSGGTNVRELIASKAGTFNSSPTYGAPGYPFSGSAATTTNAQGAPTTYVLANSNAISIEAWFKTTSTAQMYLFGTRYPSPAKPIELGMGNFGFGSSAGQLVLFNNNDNVWEGKHTNATYNDGNWHHVVGVWSGSAGVNIDGNQMTIYVDGVAVAGTRETNNSYQTAPATGNAQAATLLANRQNSGSRWVGSVQGLAVYAKALTDTQILTHYQRSLTGAGFVASSVIYRLQSGTKTIDANFLPVQPLTRLDAIRLRAFESSSSLNAIQMLPVIVPDMTAAAIVSNAVIFTGAFDAGAFVQPYFRAGAWIIGAPDAFQQDAFQDDTFQ